MIRLGHFAAGVVLLMALASNADALNLSKFKAEHDLNREIDLLRDESQKLTIKEVLLRKNQKKFQANSKPSLNFGFTSDYIWARLALRNDTKQNKRLFLEVGYPPLDHISFFVVKNGQVLASEKTGDTLAFSKRPISHRNFVFALNLAPFENKEYYLRVSSLTSVQFPLTLYDEEAFRLKNRNEQYALGVYYGIMIAMILFNAFIFVFIRDLNYLWYIIYIISFTLFVLNLNGIGYELLWPNSPEFNGFSLPFFGNLFILTILNFALQFLNIRQIAPMVYKIVLGIIAFFVLNGLLNFVLPTAFVTRFNTAAGFINILLCIFLGVLALLRGFTPARYFILAFSTFFVMGMLWVMSRFSIIPSFFISEWGMQIGSALEAVLLSFALGDRFNALQSAKEKSDREKLEGRLKLLESFSRFVPSQFLKTLNKDSIEDISAGDVREKEMTILFCDIRKFTALSESMSAEDNLLFLNSYFKRMTPIIQKHNGFIDKFIGDAIMALFNTSDDALKASLAMLDELKFYNKNRNNQGYVPIDIGIGLNSGRLVLGTVGTEKRLDTTVIGDSVNLASRVEPLNKLYGTNLIVTESVKEGLSSKHDFLFRQVDNIIVRGKNQPTKIFECFNANVDGLRRAKEDSLEAFNQAMTLYTLGDFLSAIDILGDLVAANPSDRVVAMYHRRCQRLLTKPPGEGWQGVSKMR